MSSQLRSYSAAGGTVAKLRASGKRTYINSSSGSPKTTLVHTLVGCVDWPLVKKSGSGAHELIYTHSKQKLETGNNKIKQLHTPPPPTPPKNWRNLFPPSLKKKKKKKGSLVPDLCCVTSKLPAVCISILTEYVGTIKDVWAGLA